MSYTFGESSLMLMWFVETSIATTSHKRCTAPYKVEWKNIDLYISVAMTLLYYGVIRLTGARASRFLRGRTKLKTFLYTTSHVGCKCLAQHHPS